MTPIKPGTAARLGLHKPCGVYRYRDGTVVWWDEAREWLDSVPKLELFQRAYLDNLMPSEEGGRDRESDCGTT